jgi:hypothetical protein
MLRTLFLCIVAVAAPALGQELLRSTGSDPASWNPQGAAPLAASGNHKIVYEDDSIRILSVTVPAGSAEPLHSHPWYSVVVVDQPAKTVNLDGNGNAFDDAFIAVQRTASGLPLVGIQAPQSPHSIKNLDRIPAHLTRIEFKQGMQQPQLIPPFWGQGPMPVSTDGSDPKQWNPREEALVAAPANHRVVYEDAAIRILSVTDPAGDVEKPHRHPLPSVLVFDRPAGTVLHGADGKPMRNEVSWDHRPTLMLLPAQALHWTTNPDSRAAHLTRIEFKHGFPQ